MAEPTIAEYGGRDDVGGSVVAFDVFNAAQDHVLHAARAHVDPSGRVRHPGDVAHRTDRCLKGPE
ncbi:hypothetical protein ALI22I_32110 [Saccharothrix sp. ALI-22-I]|uniref:hypothetical protein n=1 Tax=Saccharothrix sp. ALI-22-I TaxID=1933778 RepID=UPI00097C81F5|nr:hypothetical protein [Saccharothrix sp. ALI-22-I]ONI85077.1 hypothetical protein ALI22I_32110 [Saccharothrix sp. ALI-22-I]